MSLFFFLSFSPRPKIKINLLFFIFYYKKFQEKSLGYEVCSLASLNPFVQGGGFNPSITTSGVYHPPYKGCPNPYYTWVKHSTLNKWLVLCGVCYQWCVGITNVTKPRPIIWAVLYSYNRGAKKSRDPVLAYNHHS